MQIRVLGSAAGGGFPQWNCNCHNCSRLRQGRLNASARTQSSIAVTSDGRNWVLFNASPDIRAQLESFPDIQPARNTRDTGIVAVVLMDSQIDHTTGLLILREGNPLRIYCTDMVYEDLTTGFPVLRMLEHYCGIERHPVPLGPGESFTIAEAASLRFTAVSLRSKARPYSPHRHDPHEGDNIGMQVENLETGRSLFYAPGLGLIDPPVQRLLEAADCLLVDGTFWRQDEMQRTGVGTKLASDMGHLPQSGDDGMIARLKPITRPRKILIHINNTNPILDEDSPERTQLRAAGIEVAYDGMEITL